MHVGLRTAAAAALTLVVAAAAPPAGVRAADPPIEINALLTITGQTAFYGQAIAKALAVEEGAINAAGGVNGRNVHFVISDDQASPQIAVQLASALIAKGVTAIIDGGPAATCAATAAAAGSSAVVFCLSGAFQPGAFSFTTPMSFQESLVAQVRFYRVRGLTRLAFLIGTDATGQAAEVAVTNVLAMPENRSVTAVARERFANADTSVAAQIANIRNGNAQAIFSSASGTPLATILRDMRDAGLSIPIATTAANQSAPQLTSYGSIVPADLEMVAARWAAYDAMEKGPVKDKVTVFRNAMAKAGLDADGPASISWDFGQFITDAYKKFGDKMTATNLRDFVATMKGAPGICGVYDYVATPGRGLTAKDTVVLRWNGTRKTFDPISTAGGTAVLR